MLDGWIDGIVNGWVDRQKNTRMDRWMVGWLADWMSGSVGRWLDRWMKFGDSPQETSDCRGQLCAGTNSRWYKIEAKV